MSDETEEENKEEKKEESRERPRLRNFAKKIFGESETTGEGRDILGAVWETGDKAKTEVVRLVAREVRGYLDALELHKDIRTLLTDYSLEVKASFHLKPLKEEPELATDAEDTESATDASKGRTASPITEPVQVAAKPVQLDLNDESSEESSEG